MSIETYALFFATIIPLVITPGPDIIFVASQSLLRKRSGLYAVSGIIVGYSIHALLSIAGLTAVMIKFPILFELLKWAGVIYLMILATKLLCSAFKGESLHGSVESTGKPFIRGLITSLLNPKGLLLYFAILPQFISSQTHATIEAMQLSLMFIASCFLIYTAVALTASQFKPNEVSKNANRNLALGSGGLLSLASIKLALSDNT